jgi:hypothetical protein
MISLSPPTICNSAELTAAKAVLASQEQILQRITISQPPATKGSGQRKGSAENQESLFEPKK